MTSKLLEHIDGLCGYYNLKSYDDQRTPEGTLAKSTKEFGDSWSIEDSECAPIKCPVSFQTAAWDKCSFLKFEFIFFKKEAGQWTSNANFLIFIGKILSPNVTDLTKQLWTRPFSVAWTLCATVWVRSRIN